MQKAHTSHSNFRKGLNDYNDGQNVTHYLGNSDYQGANLPEEEIIDFKGKEAIGNDFLEETESDEGFDKTNPCKSEAYQDQSCRL